MNTILALMLGVMVSTHAMADLWGPEELLEASKAATETLKSKLGETAYLGIQGITIELNAQKVAAKAKVTYADQGQVKTVSYFCHTHDTLIDCH
jgi:hypothetical protein